MGLIVFPVYPGIRDIKWLLLSYLCVVLLTLQCMMLLSLLFYQSHGCTWWDGWTSFVDGLWTHSVVSAYGAVWALSLIGMEWTGIRNPHKLGSFNSTCHVGITCILVNTHSPNTLILTFFLLPPRFRHISFAFLMYPEVKWSEACSSAACTDTRLQQQQFRGFKTKHSKQSTGVGMKRSGADDSLKALRQSVSQTYVSVA